MRYSVGFEHYLLLKVLAESIPKGATHLCEPSPKRMKWLNDNPHLLAGTMLLTSFAYAEGTLGANWIRKFGKGIRYELRALRITRNAIAHNGGNITANRPSEGRTGHQQYSYVTRFVSEAISGNYTPLKAWPISRRKDYIHLDPGGHVRLGKSSYGRVGAVVLNAFMQAGVIVV